MIAFRLQHGVDGGMIDVRHQDLAYPRCRRFPDGLLLVGFKLLGINMGMGIDIL